MFGIGYRITWKSRLFRFQFHSLSLKILKISFFYLDTHGPWALDPGSRFIKSNVKLFFDCIISQSNVEIILLHHLQNLSDNIMFFNIMLKDIIFPFSDLSSLRFYITSNCWLWSPRFYISKYFWSIPVVWEWWNIDHN